MILVNLSNSQVPNLPKFSTSKIGKNNIFRPFDLAKIWFHVKLEWRYNDQTSTKSSLNFTFWKFLEHSAIYKRTYLIYAYFLYRFNIYESSRTFWSWFWRGRWYEIHWFLDQNYSWGSPIPSASRKRGCVSQFVPFWQQ